MVESCIKCKRDLDPKENAAFYFEFDGYLCEQCLMKYGSESAKKKWEMQSN